MASTSKQMLLKKLQSKAVQSPSGVATTHGTNTASEVKKRELLNRLNTMAQNQQTLKQNLSTPAVQSEAQEGERTWFQKGAFEDGWQKGDGIKAAAATKADAEENLTAGGLSIGEKILDALSWLGTAMAGQDLMQAAQNEMVFNYVTGKETANVLQNYQQYKDEMEDETVKFIAKDLYDAEKIAHQIISGKNYIPQKIIGYDTETDSFLGEKSDALVQSGGQLVAQVGANTILPGSGMALMATTAFGSEVEGAFRNGADFSEAGLSGAISAGAEILTEKLGGISFGGKTLTDAAFNRLSRKMTSKLAKALITTGKVATDMTAEGAEELLSGYMSAIGQQLTYMEDEEIEELFSKEDALESFIGGVVLGGFGGVSEVARAISKSANPVSGLTKNEEKVANKVYEDELAEREKNGKLSAGEKTKLYDSVVKNMEQGRISIDTIESVLGGDTYKGYQSLVEQEKALTERQKVLQREIDALQGADNTIGNNRKLQKAESELEEVTEKLKSLDVKSAKSNLFSQVDKLTAKDTKLRESYNERTRRGQAFTADLTKYDAKQQETVKRAIESGILNNTNRTHEFVDLIAKISASKGVSFDFADNAKLKESGFAIDGKQVNGFVTAYGVTININSAKALNAVVGHEITHVLEGTELYTELQSAITEYAKSKGDYQGRYDTLTELYKDIEGADIDAELTADLVGDYLFTDADFVQRLSTEHRGVFQKLFDEIKHLCKLATAGTKEARELEKVKKLFEDAYRTETKNPTADGGVKYSITEGMTDAERYAELKDKNIEVAKVQENAILDSYDIEGKSLNDIFKFIRENKESLGLNKVYQKDEIQLEFGYSNRGIKKSIRQTADSKVDEREYLDILSCLDQIIDTSVLIERHGDKSGEQNTQLKQVYVLLGAFQKNGVTTPVQLEIKESVGTDNQLYLAVAIKKSGVNATASAEAASVTNPDFSVISIHELIEKINPDAKDFLKYIPDGFLTPEQMEGKKEGIRRDIEKYPNSPFRHTNSGTEGSVEGKLSLSGEGQTAAPAGGYRITGEDIALAPTKEDIAAQDIATAQDAPDNDTEELGAPTREDIARMERDKKLKGPLLMKDSLDRELEKLYRLQQTGQLQDNAYFVELFKVNAAYQAAGRDFTEAFNRVLGSYQADAKTQPTVAGEDSTAVNTDPAQHTPEEQAIIDEYQAAVDEDLVNYVEKVKTNPGAKNGRYTLKNVSDRAAADIKKLTGVDVAGNKTQIEGRIVEHILKRHGENGKADQSMRDVNDIARIQYVLDNYDNAEYSGKSKGYVTVDENGKSRLADTVTFSKKVNGTYYVVEAVPDTKSKTVFVVSARMAKNEQKTTQQPLNPVVQKPPAKNVQDANENTAVVPGTTVPTKTVPQNFDDVKSDEEIIKTVKERLSAKITNSTEELSQIKLLRDWVKASYDHKIANLQAEYDGKKNKDTKTAVRMKNRLESLKRISADLDADLQKRISDIEARIAKASEKMAEPSVKDILEVRYERIDKKLQEDKASLEAEFQKKKADSQAAVADKSEYIRKKAKDLYWELNNLRKGVRASAELGYLKDSGYSWEDIKTALVNVSNSPDKRVNIHSAVESTARQMLNDSYESAVYDADELDGDYQRAVAELEEEAKRQKEAVRKDYERTTQKELHKGIMDRIRDALAKAGFELNAVLKNAKNLSTFATVDNTPQRVNEKTFGYKAGQIINDMTVNKAALNESDGIQWLNGQIDKIRKMSERYGIKPGSKESRAAQIYGEGFWVNEVGEYIQYGDAELAADFPDTEKQAKIKALAKSQEVRQMYDDTLDAINEARVRNGYPPIPRRENYFLHFRAQDDTFSRIGVPFNPNDVRAKDLPTDLNGVTADLKPGKPFFASEMHRTGDKTTHDLIGGLERYMNSAKNQIYHIDDIQTLRAMRNYIADMFGQANGLADLDSLSPEEQEQRIKEVFDNHLSTYAKFLNEEANIFAGKTALIDRGVEGVLGRRAIQFLHTLNGQVGKNMVGYNISSAGTNVLPVVQATAMLPKADMVKAFAQTISNKFHSDGFVESDPALIRRKGADQFAKTPWQRISDPGYALMSAVDNLSSELIVRAKYNELTRKGMDSQQAHVRAGEWASRLMGDRSLGQMPQLYNSKTLGLITKFQLEVRNQLDAMGYDVIQEAKAEEGASNAKKAAKVASTIAQLAIFQHLFGLAYESIAGYNPAFDIVENLIKLFGFDDEEESEDTFGDNVEQAFLGLLEDLPYTSTFTGGRIPIASALPVKEVITGKDSYGNDKDRWETLAGALPYYVLPGGYGQIKKTTQGLKMFDEDLPVAGSYTESGNLRFPVEDDSIADWLQAALFGQYANKNAREYFDNGWTPLKEKQIEEFASLDIPIADYREIRKHLGKLGTTGEKLAYIHTLDLPVSKKNILANNLTDRKTPIDMADWGKLEEFDYAVKYPEKAQFLVANGVSVEEYNKFDDETKDAYDWAYLNPDKYAVSKTVTDDIVTYRTYTKALSEIKADKYSAGKTVSGSRKKKVVQYINGLDAEYGAKLVLYKMEYPSDDTYNGKIIQYVNGVEGFTFEQKATVLKELGFTVTSDGRVTWN